MPVFVGAVKAVTYEELMPFFSSKEYLQKRVVIEEKKPAGMKRLIKGGNGRNALIAFDSLPLKIQKALSNDKEPSAVGQFFQIDLNAQKFFYEEFRFENGASLRDKDKELYTTNASVINAVLQLKKEREVIVFQLGKKKPAKLWEGLLNDMLCFADRLATDYHRILDLPTNIRAFERVVKKYQSEGYSSLVSGKYLNQNRRKATENVTKLLDSMFATQSHKPTPTEVSRQYEVFVCGMLDVIKNETGELYAPCDFSPISQSTIIAYLRTWDSKIGSHQRRKNDRQKLIGEFNPFHGMDLPKFAGSLFSIDDRQPPFEYESGKRVWFYNGADVASGCITTWVYGKDKKGIILEFYRQMVRNYYDWGINLPFELECESNLNSEFKETLLKEGNMFQSVRIEANNARGKYIERINEVLRYDYEKKYDGWIARPNAKKESNRSDNQPKQVCFDYILNVALKCIQKYNNDPCPADTSKSRFEFFLENQHKDIPETNYPVVIRLLGYKTKTSCRVGRVALNGGNMFLGSKGNICTGRNLINLMKLAEGEALDVYWLDDNNGNILKAYAYIGDKCICELLPEPRYQRATLEQTAEDKRKRSLMSAYQMTIEHYGRQKKQDIDAVTIIDHRKTAISDKFQIKELKDRDIVFNNNFDVVETLPELNEIETMIKDNLIGVETQQSRPLFNGNF